jgi:imidazolonepropionase
MSGSAPDDVGAVERAAVVISDGRVAWTGPEAELPAGPERPSYDAGGACVIPGFVDPHTHLVWAGVRRDDFLARLRGESYAAGGIKTTVAATRNASTDELTALALARTRAMLAGGTTTVEVKTGYGLTFDHELRLLDVIAAVDARTPIRIEPTYLGAHIVPDGRDRIEYVDELLATMAHARDRGARWCDVFCDRGAFTVEEARRIFYSAKACGLELRIHAEQLEHTGATALAAEVGCASADHLDHVTDDDARAMAASGVVATLLPTVTLSTRTGIVDHVRTLRAAGVTLALATDCNPGTSWCESMPYAVQLACLLYGLDVPTAMRAATRGSARSLHRDDIGHLGGGARGDLAVLAAEHEADLVAHLGARPVDVTVVGGELWLAE